MAKKLPPQDDSGDDTQDQAPSGGGMSGGMMQQGDDGDGADNEASPDDQQQDDGGDQGQPDQGGDQGGDAGASAGGEMTQKATPQQQQQYSQFVNNGYHLIYAGGKPNANILKQLSAGNPVRCLAMTTVTVVMALLHSAQQKGVKLDGAVILKGGQELFQNLADLAGKAKIHQYTQGEIDAGWVMAMHAAQQQMQQAGMLDPKAFARDVQEMNQAQQDGKLDEILPGIGSLADAVQQGVQEKQGQGGGQQQDGGPADAADDASQGAGDDGEGAGAAAQSGGAGGDGNGTGSDDGDQPPFSGFGG